MTNAPTRLRTTTWVASLLVLSSCGEAPVHVDKAQSAPGGGAVASSTSSKSVRFAGRVYLTGSLATAKSGSLFVIVRQPGSRVPSLTRKYEIADPAWSLQDDMRMLYFALDERDNMGGVGAPMNEHMELEVRYDPDGIIDTADGVEKTIVSVSPGDTELAVTLSPTTRSTGQSAQASKPAGG